MHNLNWFRGEVRSIIDLHASAVSMGQVDTAIEYGQSEAKKKLFNHYAGHFRTNKYYDVLDGKDRYPFPEDMEKMSTVERLDLATSPIELDRGTFAQRNIDPAATDITHSTQRFWAPLSEKEFVIGPSPGAFYANGLRIFYIRRPKPMVTGEDLCELPDDTHYFIVYRAIDNLLLKPGVGVANVEKYETTRREYEVLMDSIIVPTDETGVEPIVDNDPYAYDL